MNYIRNLAIVKKIRSTEMLMSITDIVIDGFLALMVVFILIAFINWVSKIF